MRFTFYLEPSSWRDAVARVSVCGAHPVLLEYLFDMDGVYGTWA
jgi:hypothetical protein